MNILTISTIAESVKKINTGCKESLHRPQSLPPGSGQSAWRIRATPASDKARRMNSVRDDALEAFSLTA